MQLLFACQRQLLFFILFCFHTGFSLKAVAQVTIDNFRLYTVKDGLASNYIKNLLIDTKGFLWVGTLEGINRFDGKSFNNLVTTARDFTSHAVECIRQVNDSIILIGTNSGIVVFNLNSNSFQNSCIKDSLLRAGNASAVSSIVPLPKGQCLVMAGNYVFLLNSTLNVVRRQVVKKFYQHAYSINNEPVFLDKDSTRILVTTPDLREFNTATFRVSDVSGSFAALNRLPTWMVNSHYKISDSILLYSPWSRGLHYLQNGINHPITSSEQVNPIRQIKEDPSDKNLYWLATGKGIASFNKKTLRFSPFHFKASGDISTTLNICRGLLFDKYGNRWIATEAGLVKISSVSNAFKDVALSYGSEWLGINDAIKDKEGNFWLSSWGKNIFKAGKTGKVLRHFDEKTDRTGKFSEKLLLANDTVYAATSTGSFYFDKSRQRFVSPPFFIPDSLKTGGDKFIYRDSHHNWWIGYYGRGLYRFNEKTGQSNFYTVFRSPSSPDYLEMLYATSVAEDRQGNLWMGRSHGSATFTKWNWQTQTFTTIPLVISGQTIRNFGINSLVIDKNENVWAATTEFGVLQYNTKSGQWTQYDKRRGLGSLFVESLALDETGSLWAGTYNGLSVLYSGKKNFVTFSREDGLPFTQIFWVGFPDRNKKDSLLIAGSNKLVWVSLSRLKKSDHAPAISIQYVYVNNQPFFDFDRHSFDHTQSGFRFVFTSVNLQNGANTYAYRLRGAGNDWIEIEQVQEVSFNNLAAGKYMFEVKVKSPEGIWSEAASYAFTIRRPYYQQWWFYILLAASVFAIGYSLYRYRVNKIKDLYKIRSHISRDLHDEVGSTLSSISIMNEMARSQANGNAMLNEKIADNLQKVQNSMQDIVWAVNPKNDDLDHLLLRFSQVAQEMLESKGILYNFTAPPDLEGLRLSMEHRREIYLIYKEWLNNVIKYSGCTVVDIRFSIKGKLMHLFIADNGIGFDTTGNYGGNGLKNMQERAWIVKGSLFIYSEEQNGAILDLKVPLS